MSSSSSQPFIGTTPHPRNAGNHVFVDNVRFWCMFSIIAMHSVGVIDVPGGNSSVFLQAGFAPLKFGTVGFFLISGFLLGERVDRSSGLDYFRLRLQKVFLPWLLWFCISVAILFLLHGPWNRAAALAGRGPLLILAHWVRLALVSTALWFVPNLLCGLGLLLLCKRYLPSLRFGLLLAAVNLFYIVNIYTAWIPNGHTEALFGYVIYLWLGAFAARHYEAFRERMTRVPIAALVGLILLAGIISFGESRLLTSLGNADPTNTLRASNQILSVLVVLFFFKIRRVTFPAFVDVRKQTFGLYFTHSLLLITVRGILEKLSAPTPLASLSTTNTGRLTVWLVSFALVYSICLGVCRWLAAQPALAWTIGADSGKDRRPLATATVRSSRPSRRLDKLRPTSTPAPGTSALVR